ncbi:hypothetical protein LZ30DRAFT_781532 [Colletotrichum cereale]|nr:hypothetical protein LZ30DRAFT_781532 [Colletotrichum cereale]
MKATLILTALLGAAIASPVAIANVEVEKRDLEPRALQGLPINVFVINGDSLQSLKLGIVPTDPITQANIIEILTTLLRTILSIGRTLDTGMAGNLGMPTTPTLPNNPVASITKGNITLDQARALVDAMNIPVTNITSIGQNLPPKLSPAQLKDIAAILTVVQQVLTSIITKLSGVTSPNGVTGSAASVGSVGSAGGLQTPLAAIGPILNNVSTLIGGGIIAVLTGLLGGGLDTILAGLPKA